jgi:hypothetical protein
MIVLFSFRASMSQGFLPLAYTYMNLFVLLIGLFAVVHNESVDAMFLVGSHVYCIQMSPIFYFNLFF